MSTEMQAGRGWRPLVITFTALITLALGFAGFVMLAPDQAPSWLRGLGDRLGMGTKAAPVSFDAGMVGIPLDASIRADIGGPDGKQPPDSGPDSRGPASTPLSSGATLEIRSTPRLLATVDGKRVGLTPVTVRATTGTRVVRLVSTRLRISLVRRVEVQGGSPATLNVKVGRGRLVVRARPWAHVYVDGVKRGTTPMRPISIYEGKHTVKLTNDDAPQPYQKTVMIHRGRTATLVHRFE